MKKFLMFLLAVPLLTLVSSCSNDENDNVWGKWHKSETWCYITPKSDSMYPPLRVYDLRGIPSHIKPVGNPLEFDGAIDMTIIGDYIREDDSQFGDLCAKYNDFCEEYFVRYNDVSYQKLIPTIVLGEDIQDIKMTALDDFDENHPAGSSLNDVIMYEWVSCYEYFHNGNNLDAMSGNGSIFRPQYANAKHFFHALLSDKSIFPIRMQSEGTEPMARFTEDAHPAPGSYRIHVHMQFETCQLNNTVIVNFAE